MEERGKNYIQKTVNAFSFVQSIMNKHTLKYLCNAIPEFDALRKQTLLTEGFKKESRDKNQFILLASNFIFNQIFKYNHIDRSQKSLFFELKKRGYSEKELSNALAESWYEESDFFCLEKRSWINHLSQKTIFLIISILLAITSTIASLLLFRALAFTVFTKTMVFAAILIPILGIFFAIIYFYIIRALWVDIPSLLTRKTRK